MLEELEETCPYCGSTILISIDCSLEEQDYYEDCTHCCQPILFVVRCNHLGRLEMLELKTDRE